MKLHQDTVNKIRVAGMLHDIGKIGIDESVLNKPAKLDADEWELMKLHSAKGAKILGNTVEFHQIAEWVLQHHERIDGKGYPNQVKGNEIPLAARIISVADAYDAMTNERPYQKAMSPEEARKVLLTGAGTQWDSKVVDILLEQVVHELKR
ncbi:Cyclic di-GMP phosphodiesterase response regulator RpfG [bioreactor metagenome]|uniref:Cyclic di-GMP phosphodiesterase response regulator RpfG n=1 Tax=bioreactor metagenome TaxID=1076179 RepID=A0A645BJX2_9ZZZZ